MSDENLLKVARLQQSDSGTRFIGRPGCVYSSIVAGGIHAGKVSAIDLVSLHWDMMNKPSPNSVYETRTLPKRLEHPKFMLTDCTCFLIRRLVQKGWRRTCCSAATQRGATRSAEAPTVGSRLVSGQRRPLMFLDYQVSLLFSLSTTHEPTYVSLPGSLDSCLWVFSGTLKIYFVIYQKQFSSYRWEKVTPSFRSTLWGFTHTPYLENVRKWRSMGKVEAVL